MAKEKLNSNGKIAFNGEEAKLFSNFVMKIVERSSYVVTVLYCISTLEEAAMLCFFLCLK